MEKKENRIPTKCKRIKSFQDLAISCIRYNYNDDTIREVKPSANVIHESLKNSSKQCRDDIMYEEGELHSEDIEKIFIKVPWYNTYITFIDWLYGGTYLYEVIHKADRTLSRMIIEYYTTSFTLYIMNEVKYNVKLLDNHKSKPGYAIGVSSNLPSVNFSNYIDHNILKKLAKKVCSFVQVAIEMNSQLSYADYIYKDYLDKKDLYKEVNINFNKLSQESSTYDMIQYSEITYAEIMSDIMKNNDILMDKASELFNDNNLDDLIELMQKFECFVKCNC